MSIPVSMKRTHFYAMKFCEGLPDNEKVIFELKILPMRKMAQLFNWEERPILEMVDDLEKAFQESIVGWKNVYDFDGNAVEFSKENINQLFDIFGAPDIKELAQEIIRFNTTGLIDKKN